MKISAGIVIIYKNRILLCRPTNGRQDSLAPPKGGVEFGENTIDAAIRETYEEVGIKINKSIISNIDDPILIEYRNKKKILYKVVYLYLVNINDISEIGLIDLKIEKKNLQLSEIDYAKFLTREEMKKTLFHRYRVLLNYINI